MFEQSFILLQGDSPFFGVECVATLYLLLSQSIISEKFLMPSLDNISNKYNFNASGAGILIAFGISIPELAVTLLSFQRHGIKMTEFGLATVFGSVCFATTFIPAFAYLVNFGVRESRPALTSDEKIQNEKLMPVFLRDMGFICIGLVLFYLML